MITNRTGWRRCQIVCRLCKWMVSGTDGPCLACTIQLDDSRWLETIQCQCEPWGCGGRWGTLYLYCTDTTFTLRPHLRYINILIYERGGKHKQQYMIVLHWSFSIQNIISLLLPVTTRQLPESEEKPLKILNNIKHIFYLIPNTHVYYETLYILL